MPSSPGLVMAVAALGLVASACAAESDAAPPGPRGTVSGVGVLPEALSRVDETRATTTTTITTTTTPRSTVAVARDELAPIGERVSGNRLLMIGDSILASTSRRYTGEMCLGLVPLHWAVEIDAETSRFIEFGERVLDARLDAGPGWDVAAVFLGTNFNGDLAVYRRRLDELLGRLAPRPTLLYTITEFRPNRAEVNGVIRDMLAYYPEVQIVDWAKITADDPNLLAADGYHLSPAGISRLVIETAAALGTSPTGSGGECLSSRFNDDSAGRIPGLDPTGPATTAPRGTGPRATTTTVVAGTTSAPSVTTTASPASTSSAPTTPTTTSPTTPPTTASTASTAPPTTTATTPATTQAPTTAAPTTHGPPNSGGGPGEGQ